MLNKLRDEIHENHSEIGKRYGMLTCLSISPKKANEKYLVCKCDCGKVKEIRKGHLTSGATISCGCYNRQLAAKRLRTHGLSKTKLYITWSNMKNRCYNPNNKRYNRYGERGIIVCEEWLNDFEAFAKWAQSNGYSKNLTVDRIDNDGNYEASNCRWVDATQQANNRSNTIYIELNGRRQTIKKWSKELGLSINTIRDRMKKTNNPKAILRKETINGKRLEK